MLKKGEAVENDRFKVELIKTIAPIRCAEPFAENDLIPRAVLRLYKADNKQPILNVEVTKGATSRLINYNFLVNDYGVGTIFVREINTKDEWVWFELWK